MKHHITLLALLLAPLAALHADAPVAEPITIVAFGASTTAVRGSTKVYASVLQEELQNVRVINAGVPGNTTEVARKRFEQDVLMHQPQIVIIQLGINDAAVDVWKKPPAKEPRVSSERYEANLRHFVQTLKSKNARVVLMTPNPLRWTPKLKEMYGKPPYQPENVDGFNAPLAPYCEAARRVAREEGAEVLDMQQAFVEQAQKQGVTVDSLLSDGMHPNDGGHRIEADLLRECILALAKTHGLAITEGPRWKASGEFVKIHPLCTDITHDSPNPTVLGCGLARMKDGAVMTVYSTPTGYYSTPGTTWIAGRVTTDGGKTWSPESVIARHSDCQPSHPSVLTTRDGEIHAQRLELPPRATPPAFRVVLHGECRAIKHKPQQKQPPPNEANHLHPRSPAARSTRGTPCRRHLPRRKQPGAHGLHIAFEIRHESLHRARHRLEHRRIRVPAQQHRPPDLLVCAWASGNLRISNCVIARGFDGLEVTTCPGFVPRRCVLAEVPRGCHGRPP